MSTQILRGNMLTALAVQLSVDVGSITANTTIEQDVTIPGVRTGDVVLSVSKPSHSAGAGVVNWRVKAANTVSVTFGNFTGSAIDPAAETYTFIIARPESVTSVFNI